MSEPTDDLDFFLEQTKKSIAPLRTAWSVVRSEISGRMHSFQEHFPRLSRWAAKLNFVVFITLGLTMIQVDEYGFAIFFWLASALVLTAKALSWKGIRGHPRLSNILKTVFSFGALMFLILTIIWTRAKRSDKPWTNLAAYWMVQPLPPSPMTRPEPPSVVEAPKSKPRLTAKPKLQNLSASQPIRGQARLLFSFPVRFASDVPRTSTRLPLGSNGAVKLDFTVYNPSDIAAEDVEIWVAICGDCRYAREPDGFQKLPGMEEHQRYRKFFGINAGIGLADMRVEVIPPPPGLVSGFFQISFNYACRTCGKVDADHWQTLDVLTFSLTKQ